MLEGKFRDRAHLKCSFSLYLATPTNIAWFETGYFAKCPRCLDYLQVDVDPDSISQPEPEPEIIEMPTEPEVKPVVEAEVPIEAPEEGKAPEIEPKPRRRRVFGPE